MRMWLQPRYSPGSPKLDAVADKYQIPKVFAANYLRRSLLRLAFVTLLDRRRPTTGERFMVTALTGCEQQHSK
jgi:hypothetical protein